MVEAIDGTELIVDVETLGRTLLDRAGVDALLVEFDEFRLLVVGVEVRIIGERLVENGLAAVGGRPSGGRPKSYLFNCFRIRREE